MTVGRRSAGTTTIRCWSGCAAIILTSFPMHCGPGFAPIMRARARLLWLLHYRYIQLDLRIVSPGLI